VVRRQFRGVMKLSLISEMLSREGKRISEKTLMQKGGDEVSRPLVRKRGNVLKRENLK